MTLSAYLPISEISTYNPKWTICARVTSKGTMRTFNRKGAGGGDGKVFDVHLLDASGSEIRASFFNEAVDRHLDMVQVGKCFTFSKGNVKVANKQYNNCNHRYEIVFDRGAEVTEVKDDANIQTVKFSFVDLKSVMGRTLPTTVDICGVITEFQPINKFTSKEGKDLVKREITVADDTGYSMSVALWAANAQLEDKKFEEKPVVALKAVVVKEFRESRQGSLLASGGIHFQPAFPEVEKIQRWWSEGGKSQDIKSISQTVGAVGGGSTRFAAARSCSLSEMKMAAENVGQTPENFSVVTRLALLQLQKQGELQQLHYSACAEPKDNKLPCNRRLDASGFCASCNKAGKAQERFNTRCRFADFGDSSWLTTFHEGSEKVLSMKAEEAKVMEQGEGGREKLESAIRQRYFTQPLQLLIRVKQDLYQGELRQNITCTEARPVPRAEHGRLMLKEIREMLATSAAAGA